jgi:hypothetical protein
MRATGFAVVLAATQPGQAYLMGRAALPFTNAAYRKVVPPAVQTSACTAAMALGKGHRALGKIPDALQAPACIGGMVSTLDELGSCVEACLRNGTDLCCTEWTSLDK